MIYVDPSHNSNGIEYNSLMYVFMRKWYLPELPNFEFKNDSWFAVPALRTETRESVSYTIINSRLEMAAMMIVSENGMLLKANRSKLHQKVPDHQLQQIEQQAFNISNWEKINQLPFPYDDMFDGKKVKERYHSANGTNTEAYFSIASENQLFTEIKKVVSPKPCNCGKAHYLG